MKVIILPIIIRVLEIMPKTTFAKSFNEMKILRKKKENLFSKSTEKSAKVMKRIAVTWFPMRLNIYYWNKNSTTCWKYTTEQFSQK